MLNNQPFGYIFPNGIKCGGTSSFDVATFSGTVVMSSSLTVGGTITAGSRITSGPSTTSAASVNMPPGTAPTSPNNGDFWTTANGVYAQIGGKTTDIATHRQGGRKNMIINGRFMIDERQYGAAITVGPAGNGYGMDRWRTTMNGAGVCSVGFAANNSAPGHFYLRHTVTTADTSLVAGELHYFGQAIEWLMMERLGWGSPSVENVPQPAVLSFWVRSSLTGTFGCSIRSDSVSGTFYVCPLSFTINAANTWEKKTITVPAPTTTTQWPAYESYSQCYLLFDFGCGSNYFGGTSGSWTTGNYLGPSGTLTKLVSTNGATFDLALVQFEAGTSATLFEDDPFPVESLLCRRYFQRYSEGSPAVGVCNTATAVNRYGILNTIPFRANPTLSVSGTLYSWDGTSWGTFTTLGASYSTANFVEFDATLATGAHAANRTARIYNNGGASIRASAEISF